MGHIEGELLIAEGESCKGAAYIARITGLDRKYRYAREFLGDVSWHGKGIKRVSVPIEELNLPEILEIRAGGSWKNDYRNYYFLSVEKELVRVDEKQMRELLAIRKDATNGGDKDGV